MEHASLAELAFERRPDKVEDWEEVPCVRLQPTAWWSVPNKTDGKSKNAFEGHQTQPWILRRLE